MSGDIALVEDPSTSWEPPLPMGRRLELPGRGTTFVRCIDGPPGAPTVVLLHGWIASGGLNWFNAFGPLAERYSVVAPDLRGHGRGLRSRRRFRLADCADDVAATLLELGTGPVIAVGYSMGGPVAQLLWRRHPELVEGLVLCATSYRFISGARERFVFGSMMATAVGTTRAGELLSRTPGMPWLGSLGGGGHRNPLPTGSAPVPSGRLAQGLGSVVPRPGARPTTLRTWAAGEMRRHDLVKVMEAGQAIGSYNARRWIGEVDVPTTVLVTAKDRAVPPSEQHKMAAAIPGSEVHLVDDGHVVCARPSFGPVLVRAVDSVAARRPATATRLAR